MLKMGKKIVKGKLCFFVLLLSVCTAPLVFAKLTLESVYPNQGVLGQDFEVTLKGTGFDDNTRLSMGMDVGNIKAIIGSVDTPGFANDVTVDAGKAYVADGSSGLQIVDISSVDIPKIIGSVDTPGHAYRAAVSGDRVYLADGSAGFHVIDIGSAIPKIVGTFNTDGNVLDLAVDGQFAYVADDTGGLIVADISNETSPQHLATLNTEGRAVGIALREGKAYVSVNNGEHLIVDIQAPQTPVVLDTVKFSCTSTSAESIYNKGITVTDDGFYIADRACGLQVASEVPSFSVLKSVDTPGDAQDVAIDGAFAYVADGKSGLQIINIDPTDGSQIIGTVDTPGMAKGVAVEGDKAYVADGAYGLQVIDVSEPSISQTIATIKLFSIFFSQVLSSANSLIYTANGGGLKIIDISDPVQPQISNVFNMPFGYTPNDLKIVGDKAFIPSGEKGLLVVDISDPAKMEQLFLVETVDSAYGVAIDNNVAYVADGDAGLQIIDFSVASSPEIIGSLDTPGWALSISVVGSTAYLAASYGGLLIIDVADPHQPKQIGQLNQSGSANHVVVQNGKVYVAGGSGGLHVFGPGSFDEQIQRPFGVVHLGLGVLESILGFFKPGLANGPCPIEIFGSFEVAPGCF